jgi:hypothetical protein
MKTVSGYKTQWMDKNGAKDELKSRKLRIKNIEAKQKGILVVASF